MIANDSGLARYLHFLRRGAWIIVLTVVLSTATAFWLSERQEKLYRASVDVLLTSQALAANLANVQLGSSDPGRQATTQASLARSLPVIQTTLRGLKATTVQTFLSQSSVSAAPNADILTFSVTNHVSRLAQQLAERYAAAYTRYRTRLDTHALDVARRRLDVQLAKLRAANQASSPAYGALLTDAQQISTIEAVQSSNAQVVPAASHATQVQPKPVRNSLAAAVLGFFLGIGLAFVRDSLNTRIGTPSEIETRLGLPQLATIPRPPRRRRPKDSLLMLEDPWGRLSEAFWILATNFELVNVEHDARVVMFTSGGSGEGKSTTIANLAVALAKRGRQVTLIDLDLRNPSLARLYGVNEQSGLTSVALGHVELTRAVVRVPLNSSSSFQLAANDDDESGALFLLPTGMKPPNPAEFAGSRAVAEIIAELRATNDLVLVDAPPLFGLSDAVALARSVDAAVVVANVSTMKRQSLTRLHHALGNLPALKLGFIATGTGADDAHYYYSYGEGGAPSDASSPSHSV